MIGAINHGEDGQTMANIGKGGALRICDVCLMVDDHPRHTFAGSVLGVYEPAPVKSVRELTKVIAEYDEATQDRLMADLLDTGSQERHMDCCRAVGCPTGQCDVLTAGAEDKRGAALVRHLMAIKDVSRGDDSIVKGE